MQFFVVVNICVCVIFTDPPAVVDGYNEGHVFVSQSDVKVIVPGYIMDPVGSTALCEERVQIFGEDSGQHEQQQQDEEEEQGRPIPPPEDIPAPELQKDDAIREVSKTFSP